MPLHPEILEAMSLSLSVKTMLLSGNMTDFHIAWVSTFAAHCTGFSFQIIRLYHNEHPSQIRLTRLIIQLKNRKSLGGRFNRRDSFAQCWACTNEFPDTKNWCGWSKRGLKNNKLIWRGLSLFFFSCILLIYIMMLITLVSTPQTAQDAFFPETSECMQMCATFTGIMTLYMIQVAKLFPIHKCYNGIMVTCPH